MKVYLNDEKKSVDPRLHLKRVGIISRDHSAKYIMIMTCTRVNGVEFGFNNRPSVMTMALYYSRQA